MTSFFTTSIIYNGLFAFIKIQRTWRWQIWLWCSAFPKNVKALYETWIVHIWRFSEARSFRVLFLYELCRSSQQQLQSPVKFLLSAPRRKWMPLKPSYSLGAFCALYQLELQVYVGFFLLIYCVLLERFGAICCLCFLVSGRIADLKQLHVT